MVRATIVGQRSGSGEQDRGSAQPPFQNATRRSRRGTPRLLHRVSPNPRLFGEPTSRSTSSSGALGTGGSSVSGSVSSDLLGRALLTSDEVRRLPEALVLGFAAELSLA